MLHVRGAGRPLPGPQRRLAPLVRRGDDREPGGAVRRGPRARGRLADERRTMSGTTPAAPGWADLRRRLSAALAAAEEALRPASGQQATPAELTGLTVALRRLERPLSQAHMDEAGRRQLIARAEERGFEHGPRRNRRNTATPQVSASRPCFGCFGRPNFPRSAGVSLAKRLRDSRNMRAARSRGLRCGVPFLCPAVPIGQPRTAFPQILPLHRNIAGQHQCAVLRPLRQIEFPQVSECCASATLFSLPLHAAHDPRAPLRAGPEERCHRVSPRGVRILTG